MSKEANKTRVITGKVRLSYVRVFEPHSIDGEQEKRYSLAVIIPKTDTKTIAMVKKAVEAAKEEGMQKFGGKIPTNFKLPLRDGDEERPEDEAYKNSYFVNAKSNSKPEVVDRYNIPITNPELVYSGCFGRISMNFFAFNSGGNKGIAAGLGNVQKLEDGEKLSARLTAEEDFADIWADEDLEDTPFN